MYCIKCGAHLSDGQTVCPICETKVYHPDIKNEGAPTYPKTDFESEEFNPKGVLFVLTIVLFVVMFIPMLFEIMWHKDVEWSGYVAGGVILLYVTLVLPCWFKKPNPVIFVPCDFAAVTLFLFYVNYKVEGKWFLSFALPLTLSLAAIVSAVIAILKYVRRGKLYVFGGGLIALGLWTVLIEYLIYATFGIRSVVVWSSGSFSTLFLFGMMLIIIAIVKPLKESLRRIFFIGRGR